MRSIVAPSQGASGTTSAHPHPDGSATKPSGHALHPTGAHSSSPSTGTLRPLAQSTRLSESPHGLPLRSRFLKIWVAYFGNFDAIITW